MLIKTKFDVGQTVWVKESDIFYLGRKKDKPFKCEITDIHIGKSSIIYRVGYNELFMENEIYSKRKDCLEAIAKGSVK